MPLTRGFSDEIKDLNAEPIIGAAKGELLDDTMSRIAKHIDIPLRLYASATPDEYLNIGPSKVEAGDGAGKVTPPVDSALPSIAGGQIGFVSKTAPAFVKENGGTFTFPTTTAGEYRRLAFSVDGLGNLNAVWSAAAASVGALTDPGLLHAQAAGTPVGYIDLEGLAAAGTYKTANSATDVIENKVGSDIRIFRYGSGSGSGGAGAGASLLDPNYDETFIYYTRSDFSVDKKKFFGSTTGTENILGLGKVELDLGQEFISSNILGPVFLTDAPVINTVQVRLLYKLGKVDSAPTVTVSADGGSNWTSATSTSTTGLFVISDFTMPAGTTSTDFRVKIVSGTDNSELAGFGVNLVQDNVGAYGGDASYEMRTITSTEASTGLITLTEVKFTPGAHQLHVNYNGHDFMAPDFIELGGGQVQFPLSFFTSGDVAKFYVGYGLINQTDAPTTINNMLSSNSTLGSVQIPTGYTLDKPYMEIPSGAVVSGAGNVETTGIISGEGILATTGNVLSTGYEPTQPKYDRIEEATAGKSVGFPNGVLLSSSVLRYYEEGTWTPVVTRVSPGTLSIAGNVSTGSYTRIGNRVYIDAYISTGAVTIGTSSGDWIITGIPFVPAGPAAFAILIYGGGQTAGWSPCIAAIPPNNQLYFYESGSGDVYRTFTPGNAYISVRFSGSYKI